MTPKCVIFDCDGTLVDSEEVTNQIIAEMAGELGIKMTGEEAAATFGGKTLDAVIYKMKELSDKEVPVDWLPRLIQEVSEAWKTQLRPIKGVKKLLGSLKMPVCVASNGEPKHINQSLNMKPHKVTSLRGSASPSWSPWECADGKYIAVEISLTHSGGSEN